MKWWNRDPRLEYENGYTKVPIKIILELVNKSRNEMCSEKLEYVQRRKSRAAGTHWSFWNANS